MKERAHFKDEKMLSFSNEFGGINYHKSSLRGAVIDYIITFNEHQNDLQTIIQKTYEIFQELFKYYERKRIKARLIVKANYIRPTRSDDEDTTTLGIHFPSLQSEEVSDVEDFFNRHMSKILTRMDTFHEKGSNLILENIEYVYIELSFMD